MELLATATGTDPHTYPNKSLGILGWFYFANSQSAILCMLTPIAMIYVLRRFSGPVPFLIVSLLFMGMLFLFATRLSTLWLHPDWTGAGVCLLLWKSDFRGCGSWCWQLYLPC